MTTYQLSIQKPLYPLQNEWEPYGINREIRLNNQEDFDLAKRCCEDTKNMAGFWKQLFFPIRPNHASDLILPTTMNYVQKTRHLAASTFAVLGAVFLDLATLPIRLLTLLLRLIYRGLASREAHPLIPYLRMKGLPASAVEGERRMVAIYNDVRSNEVRIPELAPDGRAEVVLKKTERGENGREVTQSSRYYLYLTDWEIPFPMRQVFNSSMMRYV